MISIMQVNSAEGAKSVGVALSASDMFATSEGDPLPGVALSPVNARLVAYRLLAFAQEIECEAANVAAMREAE